MLNHIAPSVLNTQYQHHQTITRHDYLLCYRDGQILLKKSGDGYEFPKKEDFDEPTDRPTYLFSLDGERCFGLMDFQANDAAMEYLDLFALRTLPNKEVAWLGAVGHQLLTWQHQHRYCGRCGSKTEQKADERAIICPQCNLIVYPKLSPAIIVAITCGDKILLAKGKNYRGDFYALIAGYVDVGESIEETVAREVKEEVGLDIRNLKYVKSQPWPFSSSLMLGFTAEADENQKIIVDEKEIHEAGWFERGKLPPHASNISISGYLIEAFERDCLK